MNQDIKTAKKELDFEENKLYLNSSLDLDDKDKRDSSQSQNNQGKKKDYNFSNILATLALIVLVLLVMGSNYIKEKDSISLEEVQEGFDPESTRDNTSLDPAIDTDTLEDSLYNNAGNQDNSSDNFSNPGKEREGDTGLLSESIGNNDVDGLIISSVLGLEIDEIENLDVSYYLDDTVINSDLTNKIEEVYLLLNSFSLEEIDSSKADEWIYKFSVIPSEASSEDYSYIILLGDNINIIKEAKNINLDDENQEMLVRTFKVENMTSLLYQVNQKLSDE